MSEEVTDKGENYYESVGLFEQMLREDGNFFFDANAIEFVIEHYLDKGDADKALLACNHALALYPFSTTISIEKARILRDIGQIEEAFACIERVEKTNPYDVEVKFLKATILQIRKEYEKALHYYLEILEQSQDKALLYYHIGCAYFQLNRLPEAYQSLKKSLQIYPNEPAVLNLLLDSCTSEKDTKALVLLLEEMIDKSPYEKQLWYYLGIIYNDLQQFDEALRTLDYAIVIDDNFYDAHFAIGHVYMNMQKYQTAYETYKIAWSLNKDSAEINCHLGACLEKLELYENAISYYRKATQLDGSYADAWFGMGNCLLSKDKWYESIHFFRRAVKLNKDNADYWVALAESEYKTGNIVSSIEAYKQAAAIAPQQPDVWLNWSFIYYEQGDNDAAIDLIMEGLEDMPDNSEMQYRVVCYLIAAGQYQEAVKFLEIALALNYEQHKILFEFFPRLEVQKALQKLINQFREI